MTNKVVHWEIMGKDGKRLQQYYADLFGWSVDANNPMNYGLVNEASAGLGGGIGGGDGPSSVMIYVEVPDLQAALDRAEALGGKTVVKPTVVPDMVTYATFADPDGNVIGLVKNPE